MLRVILFRPSELKPNRLPCVSILPVQNGKAYGILAIHFVKIGPYASKNSQDFGRLTRCCMRDLTRISRYVFSRDSIVPVEESIEQIPRVAMRCIATAGIIPSHRIVKGDKNHICVTRIVGRTIEMTWVTKRPLHLVVRVSGIALCNASRV